MEKREIISLSGFHTASIHADIDESRDKFWRFLVFFVMLPVLVVSSIVVLSNVNYKRKQPRPEFVDVPYLRRITKVPFFLLIFQVAST